ncbi:MAG: PepSY domain-containing protein, partial [Clostridia bacterium]|nr:PepSY domain-containing protein [Clostridia bacterium]
RIAKEAALAIAIKDAGINEADVRDLDIELDKEREIFVYEIDFETYNNRQEIEYEYDINAVTGEIIKKEIERDG